MPHKFVIYSTDIAATLDPVNAVPAPATLVELDQDPTLGGDYDPEAGQAGRGAVIPTAGGAVFQELPARISDQRIAFSDTDALSMATITALRDCFDSGGEWYFTDGYNCWRVRFLRPDGLKLRRNLLWSYHGEARWSYEITLVPTELMI
jgi:hypothetical protein